jgi:hypothetical protein
MIATRIRVFNAGQRIDEPGLMMDARRVGKTCYAVVVFWQ